MAFAAKPHENILFPVPYAENENPPLIITNLRVVSRAHAGEVELATRDIHSVARHNHRPRLPAGIMLLLLALPLAAFGAYEIYSVFGMTAASPLSLVNGGGDEDAASTEAPPDAEPGVNWPRQVLLTRIYGALGLAAALGCALLARRLIKKRRYYILCRGPARLLRVEAKDEIQQTQIMVTVSAVKGKA